jgi:hypothetical protein
VKNLDQRSQAQFISAQKSAIGTQKWLRKTSYALCRSCRGMLDLQLSYSNLAALQFNFLEKTIVKQGKLEMISRRNTLLHDVARLQAPDRAPSPVAGPRRRSTAATAGPTASAPTSAPNTPSPHAARPRAERTDPRRPTNGIAGVLRPCAPPCCALCRERAMLDLRTASRH